MFVSLRSLFLLIIVKFVFSFEGGAIIGSRNIQDQLGRAGEFENGPMEQLVCSVVVACVACVICVIVLLFYCY